MKLKANIVLFWYLIKFIIDEKYNFPLSSLNISLKTITTLDIINIIHELFR